MYTVLIQSKKTQESFLRYHPLLAASLLKGELGVCQWVPAGQTLTAAVPELYELVRSKTSWRAVILRTEEDIAREGPTRGNNPYDFKDENDRRGLIWENVENDRVVDQSSDLIRLTHLLGGVPSPTPPRYRTGVVVNNSESRATTAEDNEGKPGPESEEDEERFDRAPQIRRMKILQGGAEKEAGDEPGGENRSATADKTPDRADEAFKNEFADEKKRHKIWAEANEILVTPPREILLVTVSSYRSSDEALIRKSHRAWYDSTLREDENFARLNHYPYTCRFLVYPMDHSGTLNRDKDFFLLWTALTVLVANPTDSDVLQAGKLYRLGVQLDQEELHARLQLALDRLDLAEENLQKELEKQQKLEESKHPGIPKYRVEIPVSFASGQMNDAKLEDFAKFLTALNPEDLEQWIGYKELSEAELARVLREVDRYLDRAADRLRRSSYYDETQVYPLSEYQIEDLRDSLEQDYENMLNQQEILPGENSDIREKAEKADSEVRNAVLRRITFRQAIRALLIPILLCLAAFAAGIAPDAYEILGIAVLVSAILYCLVLWIVLILRRKSLLRLAEKYRSLIEAMYQELRQNANVFAHFLSSVASHVHGCSFLDHVARKQNAEDNACYHIRRRLKAFELFREKVCAWANAFNVVLNCSDSRWMEQENETPKADETLFSMQDSENSTVELNRTGVLLNTPFCFVKSVEIRREEILDDE